MVKAGSLEEMRVFIGGLYGPDLHAKRVDALACYTWGDDGRVAGGGDDWAGSGAGAGLVTKHAVKEVDRLMSNAGIDVWDSFAR